MYSCTTSISFFHGHFEGKNVKNANVIYSREGLGWDRYQPGRNLATDNAGAQVWWEWCPWRKWVCYNNLVATNYTFFCCLINTEISEQTFYCILLAKAWFIQLQFIQLKYRLRSKEVREVHSVHRTKLENKVIRMLRERASVFINCCVVSA